MARLLSGALPALTALTAATASPLAAHAQVASHVQGWATATPPRAAAAAVTVTRAGEWWLTGLHVPTAGHDARADGRGVIVAVLSTGVDGGHPDLSGSVTAGPGYGHTGRVPGSQYWGAEGTAVASLIAGHGHGHGGADGITGVAPGARILSVPVTLEYDDPLTADTAITGRLASAIAAGIRYAVSHGATVIALPLDPGMLGSGPPDPATAGGSPAERAAVRDALAHGVVLVAPAGDNGASTGAVNFPAAYPGVIAVGSTARDGQLSLFTNRGSYVALTAPGSGTAPASPGAGATQADPAAGLLVAAPDGGYQSLASTDMAAALTAGVAALIRARYPSLTVAEVTRALESGATAPPGGGAAHGAGWGHGMLSASGALRVAAALAAAHPAPVASPSHPATQRRATGARAAGGGTGRQPAAARPDPGAALKSLLTGLVLAACAMIAVLFAAITFARLRRRAATRSARAGRPAQHGSHARHARTRPAADSTPITPRPAALPPGRSAAPRRALPLGGARAPRAALPPAGGTPQAGTGPGTAIVPRSSWPSLSSRRQQPAGQPPWDPAPPSPDAASPQPLAAPLPGDPHLPPWERSPGYFSPPPARQNVPPWDEPATGPMYVWNPVSATGPLPSADGQEQE